MKSVSKQVLDLERAVHSLTVNAEHPYTHSTIVDNVLTHIVP